MSTFALVIPLIHLEFTCSQWNAPGLSNTVFYLTNKKTNANPENTSRLRYVLYCIYCCKFIMCGQSIKEKNKYYTIQLYDIFIWCCGKPSGTLIYFIESLVQGNIMANCHALLLTLFCYSRSSDHICYLLGSIPHRPTLLQLCCTLDRITGQYIQLNPCGVR